MLFCVVIGQKAMDFWGLTKLSDGMVNRLLPRDPPIDGASRAAMRGAPYKREYPPSPPFPRPIINRKGRRFERRPLSGASLLEA
jgi:hypothetical protein